MNIPTALKKIRGHDMKVRKYTVWVGGSEVTQYYLTLEMAEEIAWEWKNRGYDDVSIEEV